MKTIKLFAKPEKSESAKSENPAPAEPEAKPTKTEKVSSPISAAKTALEQNRKRRKMAPQPTLSAGMVNDYRDDYAVKPDDAESENNIRKKKKRDENKITKASRNFDTGYTESSEYSTWVPPQGKIYFIF